MSQQLPDNTWRKVTPIGDAWIICKSKSHRGHVYYFNTLTGETAWNLSNLEIKKARQFTKKLESQPGATPIKCPEPKGSPTTISDTNLEKSPKKIASRHLFPPFADQQLPSPIFPNIFNPSGLSSLQRPLEFDFPQISNLPTLNTFNNVGPVNINSLGCASNIHLYNPNVWDVSQTQQVLITPSLVQLPTQDPQNVAFNNLPLNLPQTMSKQNRPVDKGTKKIYPKNRYNLDRHGNNRPFSSLTKDLWKKLGDKSHRSEGLHHSRQQHVSIKFPERAEETKSYDHNEDVIMNHRYAQTHEESSKLDLSPLLVLAPRDANTDMWFVVVDVNVVLTEFQFLNNVTDSDEKCHLMIPKHVMAQLKEYVTVSKDVKARRVLRFLSQQIEIGYAHMAETPVNFSNNNANIMLETCMEQIRNNYFLVLISDDNELLSSKDATNINIFSVIEVKHLLKLPLSDKQTKPVPLVLEKIKIVVPNNRHGQGPNREDNGERNSFDELNTNFSKNVLKTKLDIDNENIKKSDVEIKVTKMTLDAGIQTDFEVTDSDVVNGGVGLENMASKTDNVKAFPTKILTVSKPNESIKRREIKLKRSVSNQPSVSTENTHKRLFKWRRRRNTVVDTVNKSNNSSSSKLSKSDTQLKNVETNKETNPENRCDSNHPPNKTTDVIANSSYASTIDSDLSVIKAADKSALTITNVTIEETSTSGIISNSASNIDDTEYSVYCKTQKPIDRQSIQDVHNINSEDMNENWAVKCDEWISRFVQIMEEVLTVVLNQDPPFNHKALPPPWSLHEAAQCVAVKFAYHFTIKDAANKLSKIIFSVSDAKGHITMNMTRYQYMQMYSWGVYLLATLKAVTKNYEDIQIAVESLKNLLDDIKNCDLDSSSNEIFADNPEEYSVSPFVTPEASQDVEENMHEEQDNTDDKMKSVAEQDTPPKDLQKTPDNDNTPKEMVKFIRNIDIKSFFDSLNLKRVTKNSKPEKVIQDCKEDQQETSQINRVLKSTSDAEKVNEPKIIRNFSICTDFENKLKNKLNRPLYEEHDDDLDYDEDYEELEEDSNEVDENYASYNDGYDYLGSEENCGNESQGMPVDTVVTDNSNKIRYMTHALFTEVKDALLDVKMLCDFCYEEIDNPQQSIPQRFELVNMAKAAHSNLVKLWESLESMLDEHERSTRQNIQELFKEADSTISHMDEQLLLDFRITGAALKKHASVFITSIQNIISVLTA